MATAELDGRKRRIFDTLNEELVRQAETDLGVIDLVALAVAIDAALGGDGVMPGDEVDDGKRPDELNAANDG
jgi:hypothetical protein